MRTIRDTWLIFERSLGLTLRNPVWVIMGIIQPILYLLLFGPLLKNIASMPGFPPGGAFNVFVPGILVMTALFGSAFVGFGLVRRDARRSRGTDAGDAHEPRGDAPGPFTAGRRDPRSAGRDPGRPFGPVRPRAEHRRRRSSRSPCSP